MLKNLPANAGDIRYVDLIPRSGRSPGGGHGNLLQYFRLENLMGRGTWWAMIHRVSKSQTQLKQLRTHTLSCLILCIYISGSHATEHAIRVLNSNCPVFIRFLKVLEGLGFGALLLHTSGSLVF